MKNNKIPAQKKITSRNNLQKSKEKRTFHTTRK